MPDRPHTNSKTPNVFDLYQVGIIKRIFDLVCIEGLLWVEYFRWHIEIERQLSRKQTLVKPKLEATFGSEFNRSTQHIR